MTCRIIEKGYVTITDSNSPYTAVAGAQIFANTTANPITITLPASPAVGDEVTIIDASRGTFASNNLTVDRNGQPINTASNLTLTTNRSSYYFSICRCN